MTQRTRRMPVWLRTLIVGVSAGALAVTGLTLAQSAEAVTTTTISGSDGLSVVIQTDAKERRLSSDAGVVFDINDTQLSAGSNYLLSNVPNTWQLKISGAVVTGIADLVNPGMVTYDITNAQVAAGQVFELIPPIKYNGALPDLTVSRIKLGSNVITDFDNGTFDYVGTAYPQLGTDQTSYTYWKDSSVCSSNIDACGRAIDPAWVYWPNAKYYTIAPTSYAGGVKSVVWKDLRSHTNPWSHSSYCGQNVSLGQLAATERASASKFLIINADASAPAPNTFIQTKVALQRNTTYQFEAFLSDLLDSARYISNPSSYPPNASFVIILEDGTEITLSVSGDLKTTVACSASGSDWVRYASSFFSGNNTSATLALRDNKKQSNGDDIGIDDITLRPMGNVEFDAQVNARQVDVTWTKVADVSKAAIGDTVVWTVTASNAGPDAATNLAAMDVLPSGLTYVSATGDGSYDSGTGKWTIGTLAAKGTATLRITTTMNSRATVANQVTSPTGDDDPTCTDNVCAEASVDPISPGLTISKSVKNERAGATAGTAQAGDTLAYTITAQAAADAPYTVADPAIVVDYVGDIVKNTSAPTALTADTGATPTYNASTKTISWSGPLAKSQKVTITYKVTVSDVSKRASDKADNTAWAAAATTDTAPPQTCAAPSCAKTSTDLLSPAIKVEKTVKNLTRAFGIARTGDWLEYTLTVSNTGQAPFTTTEPARVHDDLSDVLDDLTGLAITGASRGLAAPDGNGITWSGALAAVGAAGGADEAVITYKAQVNSADNRDDDSAHNVAFYSPDPSTPTPTTCAAPTCAETTTPLGDPALAVAKSVRNLTHPSAAKAQAGDLLAYTVEVTNVSTAAFTAADPAGFVDDLTGVLDDADLQATPAMTFAPSSATQGFTSPKAWWKGPLAVGEKVTLAYTVKVKEASLQGDKSATNIAFATTQASPTAPTPSCDQTAQDSGTCATTTTPIAGPTLSVTEKSVKNITNPTTAGKAAAGDTLEYTVIAKNAGEADFTAAEPARVKDDISKILDDAAFDGAVTVTPSGRGAASFTTPYIVWTGALAKGDTVTLTYRVTVKAAKDQGDKSLDNIAYVAPKPDTPTPNTCSAGDPSCKTTHTDLGAPAMGVTKQVENTTNPSAAKADAGDVLKYTVTGTNIGDADFTSNRLGYVYDDLTNVLAVAMYNNDVAAMSGTAGYTSPKVSWRGSLAVGASVTITYTVTVKDPKDQVSKQAVNLAFGTDTPNIPTPSCTQPDPTCASTTTPVGTPALTVTKSVRNVSNPGAAKAQAGDILEFTVRGKNTGDASYTAASPAILIDSFARASDDATYRGDATPSPTGGQLTTGTDTLTWRGAIGVGQTQAIVYTMQVKENSKQGDKSIDNIVIAAKTTSETPPAACDTAPAGSCASTHTDVGGPRLTVDKEVENLTRSTGKAQAGDTLKYTVTAKNVGDADFTTAEPALVEDSIAAAIDDADYQNDAAATFGTVSFTAPSRIHWSGALIKNASVVITYTVAVRDYSEQGDHEVANIAWAAGKPNEPVVTCVQPDDTCATTQTDLGGPKLAVAKKVDNLTNPGAALASGGDTLKYTVTATNTGDAAFTDTEKAIVVDDLTDVLDDTVYDAAHPVTATTGAAGFTSPTVTWTGALAEGAKVEITYQVIVKDNLAQGNKKAVNIAFAASQTTDPTPNPCQPTSTTCASTETDMGTPALTISKAVVNKTRPNAAKAQTGDELLYTLTAKNSGTAAYTASEQATVTDDLSGVLDDATWNDDASGVGTATLMGDQLLWRLPLAVDATEKLSYSVTVKEESKQGDKIAKNLAFTGPVKPECDPPSGTSDCTETPLGTPELDLAKSVRNVTRPGASPAQAGDTLEYSVTATNKGDALFSAAEPAVVTDSLAKVIDDATFDEATMSATGGSAVYAAPTIIWRVPLGVGAHETLTYRVVVKDYAKQGDHSLENVATGPGTPTDCVPESDPECTKTPVGTPALSVDKVVENVTNPGAAKADVGDRLRYTVSIENTGDAAYTDTEPAIVVDDVSGVLDDAAFDAASLASSAGDIAFATPKVTWRLPLAAGAKATASYEVVVKASSRQGDRVATNVAFAARTPGETTPECASGDPTCATTDTQLGGPVLNLAKKVENVTRPDAETAQAGEQLKYTVTVRNVGDATFTAAEPARFVDDLTAVLDDATWNDDAAATTGQVAYAAPRLGWHGVLAPGASAEITYTVTVKDASKQGDRTAKNIAFAVPSVTPKGEDPGDVPDDPTPTCQPGSLTCGSTVTELDKPELTLAKSVENVTRPGAAKAKGGDTLKYTVTATNTGQADYTATEKARLVDDLSGVLDDAIWNGDLAASTGDAVYGAAVQRIVWSGVLTVGESVDVTYTVTVKQSKDQGDKQARNIAFAPGEGQCEEGKTCEPPCEAGAPECPTTITDLGTPDLSVAKKVQNTTHAEAIKARTGDVLRYTVTATNSGDAAFTPEAPAVLIDDLSGVLDDAAYAGDAVVVPAGNDQLTYKAGRLVWTGPLEQGQSITLTYTVTVKAAADRGDREVKNLAFAADTPKDPTIPECDPAATSCAETDTPITPDPKTDPTPSAPAPVIAKAVENVTHPGARATAGDQLRYTVTIRNDSDTAHPAASPLTVIDDLSRVLTVADYGSDAAAASGDIAYAAPRLTWTGALAGRGETSFTYTVTVKAAAQRTAATAENLVFAAKNPDTPTPATCAADDPTCDTTSTEIGGPGLTVTKYVETAPGSNTWVSGRDRAVQYAAGQAARFRVVVANTGDTVLTNIVVKDPLVPACSDTVKRLEPKQYVTLSCTMAISGSVVNVATATAGGLAATGEAAVNVPATIGSLPITGAAVGTAAGVAALLLAVGGLLWAMRRRAMREGEA